MFKSFDVAAMPLEGMLGREWLATNGIGGYASSTIPCLNTRKYHGLLVAAMAPPVRRMVLLSRTEETLLCDGWPHALSSSEYPGAFHPDGYRALRAFSAEPFPRWAFQADNWTLQKELCLLRGSNTVCLTYTLLAAKRPATLEVRPLLALRPIHELSYQWNGKLAAESRGPTSHRVPATTRTPEAFFAHTGAFTAEPNWYLNTIYRREQERGYAGLEDVWSPGVVRFPLQAGQSVHFVCSSDPIDLDACLEQAERQGVTASRQAAAMAMGGLAPAPAAPVPAEAGDRPGLTGAAGAGLAPATPQVAVLPRAVPPSVAQDQVMADLARAAEQFVAQPPAGPDAANAPSGPAVIGQFPWSPPSGRAAMAGFTGLFLATGRFAEGRAALLSAASHLDGGLMPSEFAESGAAAPVYQGADVALWFVDAVYAYLRYTGDEAAVSRHLLDPVLAVVANYRRGTRLGIAADADGLLRTGVPGTPTTWMDAKVGDWVVTPRQGRPVELNALWHNAVCTAAELATRFGRLAQADELGSLAYAVKLAFNRRFWNDPAECCYDVVGDRGNDSSVRPNQLLAMSLLFPALAADRHAAALERVMRELVTPLGVRTLAPHNPAYCGRYGGNVTARDKAVHCGPAFPWLLGPLVTAYARVHGRGEGARREAAALLQPCVDHLRGDGVGQLPELFDGDSPQYPGGAVASALSVAEVLRAYHEDVLDRAPAVPPGCGSCAAGTGAGLAVTQAAPPDGVPATPRG